MFSIKNLSIVSSALVFSIASAQAGKWSDWMDEFNRELQTLTEDQKKNVMNNLLPEHPLEKARMHAVSKEDYYSYQYPLDNNFHEILPYVNKHLPHLNMDIVTAGIENYLTEKRTKWAAKVHFSDEPFLNPPPRPEFQKTFGHDHPDALKYALRISNETYFQYYAIEALKEIAAHIKVHPKDAEANPSASPIVNQFLAFMDIDKKIERLKKISNHLNDTLKQNMGYDTDQLSEPFKEESIVSLIDDFKKEGEFPQWKKGDPLKRMDTKHGDEMASLVKVFSPQSTISLVDWSNQTLEWYSDEADLRNSIINCSFSAGTRNFIQKKAHGFFWSDFHPNQKQLAILKNAFPNENDYGPLSQETLKNLKEFDDRQLAKSTPHFLEKLLNIKSGSPNLVVVAPDNSPGVLVRDDECHNSSPALLQPENMKNYGLVPLNYDWKTGALVKYTKFAGEYQDMAVVVPSAYVSDPFNPIPNFCNGGNSDAAAMLSAITSQVRGYYPELTALELKQAILQGANKTFQGYQPELHGQGMVNLKGALAVAQKVVSSPNRNRPLPPVPSIKKEAGPSSNRNRPLPPLPPAKK